jgi:putative ABC transport system permease protein
MNWIRQTVAVLFLNLRTIPARLGSSAVAIIGIAGVVIVFVSVLSISAGFSAAMKGSGSTERAIIMRSPRTTVCHETGIPATTRTTDAAAI